jgi:hypothetical protein
MDYFQRRRRDNYILYYPGGDVKVTTGWQIWVHNIPSSYTRINCKGWRNGSGGKNKENIKWTKKPDELWLADLESPCANGTDSGF